MATSQRQRERYANDESYRERKLRQVREARAAARVERERIRQLKGWRHISSAPENEVILLYDPNIFWPVVAKLVDQEWECIHYIGPQIHPTHWRYMLEIPKP